MLGAIYCGDNILGDGQKPMLLETFCLPARWKTISTLIASPPTLKNYFSHPSFSFFTFFFFPTPPIKLKLGGGGETTNSKPPGPIIMIDQSEILSRSHIKFITLFSASAENCCAF